MKGRKTKLTRALIADFRKILRAGNYTEVACAKLNVGKSTFYRWIELAESRGGLFREFRDTVEQSSAHAEVEAVKVILNEKTPEQAKWFLERRFPARWGRKDRHELAGQVGPAPAPIVKVILEGEPPPPPEIVDAPADDDGDVSPA